MKILCAFFVFVILVSCNGKNIPDVSGIKIELKVERFEHDLFAIDTNHVTESIKHLDTKYHDFLPDFVNNILGLSFDSIMLQSLVQTNAVKTFIHDYKIPTTVITFIGPVDANFVTSFGTQGDVITKDALAVGLQLHIGANFS